MADSNMQLNWTDEQWNKVRQVVYEEARKARVAGNVLPLYGPLEPDARYIIRMRAVLDIKDFPGPLQLIASLFKGWDLSSDWYQWDLAQ